MAVEIRESFSATGIAVLHDSGEQPVFEGEGEQGVYGYIKFQSVSIIRHIDLEFRVKDDWDTFMGNLAELENDGLVSFRGGTYYLDSPPDPEQYAGAGSADNPLYTISLTLHRYGGNIGVGGTEAAGGGGRPLMVR